MTAATFAPEILPAQTVKAPILRTRLETTLRELAAS